MNERKVYYEIIGKGKPLVFLHGNGEDAKIFVNQIKAFKDNYQLILIDTIMHGNSDHSFKKYNFYDLAHDVLNVLKKEKIRKANFIGFSDGANILFHLALLNGDVINKAVAISGNINPYGFKLRELLKLRIMTIFYRFFNKKKYYLFYLMNNNPKLKYHHLKKINNDFLIIAGSNDVIRKKHTINISKNIENSELKIVPGFDHFAVINNSEAVNEIIKNYLEKEN